MSSSSGYIKEDIEAKSLGFETSSGDFTMNHKTAIPDVQGKSSSGDIVLRIPKNSGFALDAKTQSGNISVDFSVTVQGNMGNKKQFAGKVADGKGSITLKTYSGDLTLKGL